MSSVPLFYYSCVIMILLVGVSCTYGAATVEGTSRVKRGSFFGDFFHNIRFSDGHSNHLDSGYFGPQGDGHGVQGEDGTSTHEFESLGRGYEHMHGGHCEESRCGYNIRHCPHGCVFNSFVCGGGSSFDRCCC